jgi:hypothetical protein
MLRTLRAAVSKQSQCRAIVKYVRGQSGHQIVNTEAQPEGDYFRYIYSKDNIPELLGGFKPPGPNAYLDKPLYESDNFQFEYHGQWWDLGGNKTLCMIYLLLPILLTWGISVNKEMNETHRPRLLKGSGGTYGVHMNTNLNKAPMY